MVILLSYVLNPGTLQLVLVLTTYSPFLRRTPLMNLPSTAAAVTITVMKPTVLVILRTVHQRRIPSCFYARPEQSWVDTYKRHGDGLICCYNGHSRCCVGLVHLHPTAIGAPVDGYVHICTQRVDWFLGYTTAVGRQRWTCGVIFAV